MARRHMRSQPSQSPRSARLAAARAMHLAAAKVDLFCLLVSIPDAEMTDHEVVLLNELSRDAAVQRYLESRCVRHEFP